MDLVLQGPALATPEIASIASLAGAQGIHALAGGSAPAFRLTRIERREGVAERCAAAGIDHAFAPPDLARDRVRVVAMDMDSTLITIECIDEIADFKGVKAEVAAITESAMRGEIDFAQSLARRVALLAGLPVADLAHVYDERLRISPGAERMLSAFKAAGAVTALVSGGFTFFTDRLKSRLKLDFTLANTFEVKDDRLTGRIEGDIVDAQAKARAIRELRARHPGLSVVMGDGANDLPMFAEADVSVAYRAKPVVREKATHMIDLCGLDAVLNLFN